MLSLLWTTNQGAQSEGSAQPLPRSQKGCGEDAPFRLQAEERAHVLERLSLPWTISMVMPPSGAYDNLEARSNALVLQAASGGHFGYVAG